MKPVTESLRKRGFGYDLACLLLAYREEEIVGRVQTLNFAGEPLTISQTQHVLDMLKQMGVTIHTCKCGQVGMIGSEIEDKYSGFNECCWCGVLTCDKCSPDAICADCIRDWCPNCGKDDCMRLADCNMCMEKICVRDMCSRCWILCECENPDSVETLDNMSLDTQAMVRNVQRRLAGNE